MQWQQHSEDKDAVTISNTVHGIRDSSVGIAVDLETPDLENLNR
jgi:hypothetical protein